MREELVEKLLKDFVSSMSDEKLLEFIESKVLESGKFYGHSKKSRENWYLKNDYEDYLKEILFRTAFLGSGSETRISERLFCIVKNIKEKTKCKFCQEYVEFKSFLSGYPKSCRKKECKLKIGHEISKNGAKTKAIKLTPEGISVLKSAGQRSRDTLRLRYGDDYFSKSMLRHCDRLRNTVDENGVNGLQKRARKIVEIKKKDIVDGLDNNQRAARKSAETMKKVQEDGLTQYQKNVIKIREIKLNNIDENGNDSYVRIAYAAAKTKRSKIDPETGLTIHDLQIIKSKQTRLNNIDENGLNGFERSFANGSTRSPRVFYKNTQISYQGSLEKDFLEKLESYDMFNLVKPGSFVPYIGLDNLEHYYHPDFLVEPINCFEIKCLWTYNNNYRNNEILMQTNHLKWKSLIEKKQNSRLFVVWDKKHIQEIHLEDFSKFDCLYLPSRFIDFTKENFQNLLGF